MTTDAQPDPQTDLLDLRPLAKTIDEACTELDLLRSERARLRLALGRLVETFLPTAYVRCDAREMQLWIDADRALKETRP